MKLTSPAFEPNGVIPDKYTCDGENISPELHIHDVPQKTVSFALIVDDPDVPKEVRADGIYDHWILFNIPRVVRIIPEKEYGVGVQGKGTSGKLDYTGPCPPDREHRYFFKLYALDTILPLSEGASKKEVEMAMQGHILEQVELMGRYDRRVRR